MTTNKKNNTSERKSRIKIGKLTNNEETVKNLTDKEAEQIKGGFGSLEHATTEAIKSFGEALNAAARKG